MTFDPRRVNEEYAELENELTNLIREWRRKERNKTLEEYERKAYSHAANQLERVLKPNMVQSNAHFEIIQCEHCGVETDTFVDGECLKKCSNVIDKQELERLLSNCRDKKQWYDEYASTGRQEDKGQVYKWFVGELEEIIND